jgi:hypothetical protein
MKCSASSVVHGPNQSAVTVKGAHFLPEHSPEEAGLASASFVAKVLAGQIGRPAGR